MVLYAFYMVFIWFLYGFIGLYMGFTWVLYVFFYIVFYGYIYTYIWMVYIHNYGFIEDQL